MPRSFFKLNNICVNRYADVNMNWGSAGGVKRPSKGTELHAK